jgi:magnesium transporter
MDIIRESAPVGDICRVQSPRYIPEASTSIIVSMERSGVISKHYDLIMPKAIEMARNGAFTWVDHTASDIDTAADVAICFGFSKMMVDMLKSERLSEYVDLDTELGLKIPSVRLDRQEPEIEPSFFLVRDNLILTIHGVEASHLVQFSRYADTYLRKMHPAITLSERRTNFLIRLLDENCNDHFDQLRFIEDQADAVGGDLSDMNARIKNVGRRIFQVKHTTIVYMNTLWHLLDIINSLRFGDAELIDDNPKVLERMNLMSADITRQVELSENMSNVLVSGMDILQSLYSNQLLIIGNRLLLVVTWMSLLGTALLVPNTVATIFAYAIGLDFDLMIWSVTVIILATVTMSTLAYWWTKSCTIVPRSPDEYLA